MAFINSSAVGAMDNPQQVSQLATSKELLLEGNFKNF